MAAAASIILVLSADIVPPKGSAQPFVQAKRPRHILDTGATGFLGAGVLDPLMVTCLARAKTNDAALARVITNLQHHSRWTPQYEPYLVGIAGDFLVRSGPCRRWLDFTRHWMDGTIWALRLAVAGNKLKPVQHVSSGSVLLSLHQFVKLPSRGEIIREDDPLDPATTVLRTSYGETKRVAVKMCAQAAARGVPVTVVH
ncbi:hypothetical protein GGF31_003384 [Allomyces arbusculus]|nr:hypothetical protein GGF31_003384 [Allomyces arbusculus]